MTSPKGLIHPRWLAGKTDLAAILHVQRETFGSWTERQKSTNCPDPIPAGINGTGLSMGPIWDAEEVIRWYVNWTPRKGPDGIKLGWVDPAILKELGLESGGKNGSKTEN